MKFKVGDRVRFKLELSRGIALRGKRAIEQIKGFECNCCVFEHGISGYKKVHVNNLELVGKSKKH